MFVACNYSQLSLIFVSKTRDQTRVGSEPHSKKLDKARVYEDTNALAYRPRRGNCEKKSLMRLVPGSDKKSPGPLSLLQLVD